jgi:hypothetical protein
VHGGGQADENSVGWPRGGQQRFQTQIKKKKDPQMERMNCATQLFPEVVWQPINCLFGEPLSVVILTFHGGPHTIPRFATQPDYLKERF